MDQRQPSEIRRRRESRAIDGEEIEGEDVGYLPHEPVVTDCHLPGRSIFACDAQASHESQMNIGPSENSYKVPSGIVTCTLLISTVYLDRGRSRLTPCHTT